ncbi:hypothetical protein QJS04_geneDACA002330 [Acorus gramineus]|uniref:Alpha-carbonic anhydrase domain-containing protein n=1 Tax=Acorus gramineus TaxID=55184 RepID=A0AAV9AAQ3_ACOGR|nr:hypothetical protein QJS04_geneDACA002330 [Acorus gramineus]
MAFLLKGIEGFMVAMGNLSTFGPTFILELHMVHKSADNKIAVVGILYKIGRADNFLYKDKMKFEIGRDRQMISWAAATAEEDMEEEVSRGGD